MPEKNGGCRQTACPARQVHRAVLAAFARTGGPARLGGQGKLGGGRSERT
jgi:hypothetical protein